MSPRNETVRESLHRCLLEGPATAQDLSRLVGIPERDVPHHLEHLGRSVRHKKQRLVIEPSACLDCGFEFVRRERYTRPGKCPSCRSRRIAPPRFRIQS